MTEQMIEAAMKAMREEQRVNQNLELGFDDDVYDLAVLTIAAIEPLIRAQVFQKIREAAEAVTDAYAQDECGQAIVAALIALEKQP
jgi:hypothetical protein